MLHGEVSLSELFGAVARGELSPADALERAAGISPVGEQAFARIDHDRVRRCGMPEVVFALRKTPEQTCAIVDTILRKSPHALVTRASDAVAAALLERWPDADWNRAARTVLAGDAPVPVPGAGTVLVLAAGTSDLPVAEEARVTAEAMGCPVDTLYDVGVAGIHRLLVHEERLRRAAALVVVAGMEGALPSVVGGLVAAPVVAVPTSVGYGASFGGVAALLGMLNSCAVGVSVVNIDNGFGGGAVAARIARAAGPVSDPAD